MSTPEQDAEELEYVRTYMGEMSYAELAGRLSAEHIQVSAQDLRAMEEGRLPVPRELLDATYAIVSEMYTNGELQ